MSLARTTDVTRGFSCSLGTSETRTPRSSPHRASGRSDCRVCTRPARAEVDCHDIRGITEAGRVRVGARTLEIRQTRDEDGPAKSLVEPWGLRCRRGVRAATSRRPISRSLLRRMGRPGGRLRRAKAGPRRCNAGLGQRSGMSPEWPRLLSSERWRLGRQTHALTAGSTVVAASSTCRGSSPSGQRYTRSQPACA
jgi:hypothetical protein